MRYRFLAAAACAAVSAGAATAGVYQPNLTGPALDPTLSTGTSPGYVVAPTLSGIGYFKPTGLTAGEGLLYTSFQTSGDFDAKATIYRAYLGYVGFDFAAYDSTLVNPISTTASPGFNIFSNGPGDVQSYSIEGVPTDTATSDPRLTFELRRTGDLYESLLDGVVVNSGHYTALHPFTFLLGVCAQTCIAGNDPAYRYATLESFTVTTPDAVPEPASWAVILLGFGALGVRLRRRRGSATPLVQ